MSVRAKFKVESITPTSAELPLEQQHKDVLFFAVVSTFK